MDDEAARLFDTKTLATLILPRSKGTDLSAQVAQPEQGDHHTVLGPRGRIKSFLRGCSSLGLREKVSLVEYPGGHPSTYSSAPLHIPNTRGRAARLPDALAIKIVTSITCDPSQIAGESTCSMGGVHSKWELIDLQYVVNNVHDLAHVFVNLDPRPYRSVRVTLRQVQIRKIQQEVQGSRQERAQEQEGNRARLKAVCKKARCWSTHLFILRQCDALKAVLPYATSKGCSQIAHHGWPFFWLSSSLVKQ